MSTPTSAGRRRGATTEPTEPTIATSANVAVLRGRCAHAAARDLPGATVVVQFDVVTHVDVDGQGRTVPVPVAWYDPPSGWAELLDTDAEILVVGVVQRRFFRVGGATQSRTEVRARRVVAAGKRRELRRALDTVVAGLG